MAAHTVKLFIMRLGAKFQDMCASFIDMNKILNAFRLSLSFHQFRLFRIVLRGCPRP
jgi:hypothetical protein